MLFHEKVLIIRINVLPSSAQVPARVVVHPNYEVRGLKSLNFQRTIGGLIKENRRFLKGKSNIFTSPAILCHCFIIVKSIFNLIGTSSRHSSWSVFGPGGRLVTTLVATINIIYPFFPPLCPFFQRGSDWIKKLIWQKFTGAPKGQSPQICTVRQCGTSTYEFFSKKFY